MNRGRLYSAWCLTLGLLFFAGLAGTAVWGMIQPDREKSERENRMLRQFPAFTLDSAADGRFMNRLEDYLTDQFPARDRLVSAKTYLDLLCGKKKINGVWIGRDGWLIEDQPPLRETQLKGLTDAIRRFCEQNPSVRAATVLAPNASYMLADRLPYGAPLYDQKEVLDRIRADLGTSCGWIDCVSVLRQAPPEEPLYYRTDHHWTTQAAYRVFCRLAEEWKLDAASQTYSFVTASDCFQGTLASSSGVRHIHDTLTLCAPRGAEGSYTVSYESEQRTTVTCFDRAAMQRRNQYEVFLGGNFDKIVITTTACNDDTLLLLKDSYANCMIPMLTPYFHRIVVVDPRYFNDTVEGCMQDERVTHVLFLYNLNTFLQDQSLADVLDAAPAA